MSTLLDILNHGDFCSLLFLIVLLSTIGSKMVQGKPILSTSGWRFAAFALIAYCIYAGYTFQPADAGVWVWVVLRALLAAGLTLGLAWIVLVILHFVYAHSAASLARARETLVSATRRTREDQHRRICDDEQQRQAHLDAERQSRESEAEEAKATQQRRRADARAAVELEYARLSPKLDSFFNREMFTGYVETYMNNGHSPEDVERRGRDLIALLETHIEQQDQRNNTSLDELDTGHQAEKQRIESSPADDRLKRRLLAELNVRYAELASKLMQELEP